MSTIILFFWPHMRPYKWLYLIMLFAPVAASFYPLLYNLSIKLFIDAMTVQDGITYAKVGFPILLFLSAQLMLDVVWRISNLAEWKAEPLVRRSILLGSYETVQNQPHQFFQDNFSGSISSKIKGILDGYDVFWEKFHHGLCQTVFKTIIGVIALSFVNSILGFFMIVWVVLYTLVLYKLSLKLNQLSCDEADSRHSLIGQVSDKISNIVSILSFAARRRELKSLDVQISTDFIRKQCQVYKYDFKVQLIGGGLYLCMFSFLLFFMVHLRMKGLISIGEFAFVFGMALVLAEDIWHSAETMQDLSRSVGDLSSAIKVLKSPEKTPDKKNARRLVVNQPDIEFKDVSFRYGAGEFVFKSLDLKIEAGEKIGLVGHSGAGKSSLFNLLLRNFELLEGQIYIDGQDISKVSQDSLREHIAVIPQDISLFHRTIWENIHFGNPHATNEEVLQASKIAHVHEFIDTLPEGYHTLVGERGVKLSGGQRQRISIARAVLKDAPVLILDEATSSLDARTETLIQESLRFLIEDRKRTVIAIAHRLFTLKHVDRIIVLNRGMIVEQGSHLELLRCPNGQYKRLFELQEI